MSWQLATFTGLALVLAGGFWWYERARPSARLVALVAALAALAVAGRLVLAPIPNVVATTDIALITGYALGAGPGFAVGALAAPISNIWLGQGPWTAWQMAGWGLVGIAGAWLAAFSGRRLGRLGLALACALAGLAYGALLDLSVMVTYGGEQSLDRYLALSARGLPFNIAHAVGNFAIALAAGPALVRMISRFRTRLEFSWRPAGALPLVLLALLAGGALATGPERAAAGPTPGAWLARAQNDDGGFAATAGQPSSPAITGWAMLGLEATGTNPLDLRAGGRTPVAYLRSEIERLRWSATSSGRSWLSTGPGSTRAAFAGTDLVAELRSRRDRDGSVDGQVNLTAFYVLAMRAAGADRRSLRRSAAWLREARNPDGGWGIQPQAPSEADSTGAALQGLVAAGARGAATSAGVRWLRRTQRAGAATRSAAAGSSTRSRPPGRCRGWPRPAGAGRRSPARSATWGGCAPPTATTATRPPATRPRSGSRRRSCSRSNAGRSRCRPSPGPPTATAAASRSRAPPEAERARLRRRIPPPEAAVIGPSPAPRPPRRTRARGRATAAALMVAAGGRRGRWCRGDQRGGLGGRDDGERRRTDGRRRSGHRSRGRRRAGPGQRRLSIRAVRGPIRPPST